MLTVRNFTKTRIEIGQTQKSERDEMIFYIKVDDSEMLSVNHPYAKKCFIYKSIRAKQFRSLVSP